MKFAKLASKICLNIINGVTSMRTIFSIVFVLISFNQSAIADTLERYAGIANSIPKMALKADEKSQTWARSARSILAVTDETVAQTIMAMNALALQNGRPLICPPQNEKIDKDKIHSILKDIISSPTASKEGMTISEAVIDKLKDQYPCRNQTTTALRKAMLPFANTAQMQHQGR